MSEYEKTFDPDILEGLCDLISRYIELCLIFRHSIGIYPYFFQIMSECDQTFDPNLLNGHCDIFSRISGFALYLYHSIGL